MSSNSTVAARLLVSLSARVPDMLDGADQMVFVDVDDPIGEVHGCGEQAAAFGYSGVRGLNAQRAGVPTPVAALVIVRARLRRGNTASHTGERLLTRRPSAAPAPPGCPVQILARANSAYFCHRVEPAPAVDDLLSEVDRDPTAAVWV
ncbi:hypothetical protein EEB14_07865 [Rhodococcus sp. WS4]|nr:hypothetical protein EEB14_07865 [Rhodococcus sp. WS4]